MSDLSSENLLNNDVFYSFLNCVNTSDWFDAYIEKYFDAIFPDVIDIQDSDDNFVIFPFEKSLRFLLSKFSEFDSFTTQFIEPNCKTNSFFTSAENICPNTVYLNLYI